MTSPGSCLDQTTLEKTSARITTKKTFLAFTWIAMHSEVRFVLEMAVTVQVCDLMLHCVFR